MIRNVETAQANATLADVMSVLDELLVLIDAENIRLRSGLPASLAQQVVRKTQLADDLEMWLSRMRRGELVFRGNHDLNLLIERLRTLQELMGENTDLIRRAMQATRRRISAIMEALRKEATTPAGYCRTAQVERRVRTPRHGLSA